MDGVILAGGRGTRMGGGKALMPFAGGVLLDAVIARVAAQVGALALNVPADDAAEFRRRYRHELAVDILPAGIGPLAGVLAGLDWLRQRGGASWLATFPCDTPFLPRDLVAQLAAQAKDAPVAARAEGRLQGVCALWPLACHDRLRAAVETGALRSLQRALDHLGGTVVDIACDTDAFFNVNTPEDLARAEAMARG